VVDVGLALPLVVGMQPGSQAQRLLHPVQVSGMKVRDLDRQSLPQTGLAMHRCDRVKRRLRSAGLRPTSALDRITGRVGQA
jgi:hypothetical protein